MKKRFTLLLATLLLSAASGLAAADQLAQAKQNGLVGERADGYLGLVKTTVPEDVAALVKEVNSKRRAEYQRIAEANDLTVEQVQALAGRKAIERTEPGGWIMPNGGWQQK
jgi:hypothetical protein